MAKVGMQSSDSDAFSAAADTDCSTPKRRPAKPAQKKRNAAGRPTLAELERRKANVMRVATKLFVREGYAATSLVDIAKTAGVATRTLYQHFGDKEALFRDVMFAPESAAVFSPPRIDDSVTLFDAMMRTAEYVCNVTFRPTTVDMMRLAIAESKRFPDTMSILITDSHAHFNANIKAIFDDLVSLCLVKDEDTAVSAEMFIHLILGYIPVLIFAGWNSPLPSQDQIKGKVELFIMGRWGPGVAKKARNTLPLRSREDLLAAPIAEVSSCEMKPR